MNLKQVILAETGIIIILAVLFGYLYYHPLSSVSIPEDGLLSPRVYAGIIEPQSYMVLNYEPLRKYFVEYIEKNHYNMSIYVVNLRDGASLGINQREGYYPASLNKVPLAILILKEVEEGHLSLDQKLPIRPEDRSNASGSLFKTTEKELSIRTLLEAMLVESDNTAYLALEELRKERDFDILLWSYYGYFDMKTTAEGSIRDDSIITPRGVYNLFSSLYLSTVLTPENSEYVLSLLSRSTFNLHKVIGSPSDVVIAHKFGNGAHLNPVQFHDCGILYLKHSRIFYCVMTKGFREDKGIKVVGETVAAIYQYTLDARHFFDAYKEES